MIFKKNVLLVMLLFTGSAIGISSKLPEMKRSEDGQSTLPQQQVVHVIKFMVQKSESNPLAPIDTKRLGETSEQSVPDQSPVNLSPTDTSAAVAGTSEQSVLNQPPVNLSQTDTSAAVAGTNEQQQQSNDDVQPARETSGQSVLDQSSVDSSPSNTSAVVAVTNDEQQQQSNDDVQPARETSGQSVLDQSSVDSSPSNTSAVTGEVAAAKSLDNAGIAMVGGLADLKEKMGRFGAWASQKVEDVLGRENLEQAAKHLEEGIKNQDPRTVDGSPIDTSGVAGEAGEVIQTGLKNVIARAEEIATRHVQQGTDAGEYGMGEPVAGQESQDVAQEVGDQVITSMKKVVKALEDGVNNQDPKTPDGALFTNEQPSNNGEVVPEKKDDASNRKQLTKTGNGNNEKNKKEPAGSNEDKGAFASLGVYCAGAVSQVTAVAVAHPYWVAGGTMAFAGVAFWTVYTLKYASDRKKNRSKTLDEELKELERLI